MANEPKILSQADLIDGVAGMVENVSKKDIKAVLQALMEISKEQVGKGNKIRLIGFGTFEKKHHSARKGRNPQTGEEMQIPASDSFSFHSKVKFD